jgi:O-acetyl-ADP-ribose deacetylase (regulator of RNase III)
VIAVQTDDLAFVTADAIARPVDSNLQATTPLLRRLEAAGGESLTRQLRVNEPLAVGSAVVTGAGSLGVELLIHSVVSSDDERVSRSSVRRALTSALHQAASWRVAHLVLPPFGLGAGNIDVEESAEVMVPLVAQHMHAAPLPSAVTFVVETALEAEVFERAVRQLSR